MQWPYGKKFAFTIIDDTDNSTIFNIGPIYELLKECNIFTTKTVWVYSSRDTYKGQCLQDREYLEFVKRLQKQGFEIAFHNAGSGNFTRMEIKDAVEEFNKLLGCYPNIHVNHASNLDNIYWGKDRFSFLLRLLFLIRYNKKRTYYGHELSSNFFWGDICKEKIKYIRNHVFMGINTLKYDPNMPYKHPDKHKYSNYWFSSTDAHTVQEFNQLLKSENIDTLEKEAGCCIVYTHFASDFVDKYGNVNEEFKKKIKALAARDGWFVPATEILDYLLMNKANDDFISRFDLLKLDINWLHGRILKKIKNRK